jgi:hypothetical protein
LMVWVIFRGMRSHVFLSDDNFLAESSGFFTPSH